MGSHIWRATRILAPPIQFEVILTKMRVCQTCARTINPKNIDNSYMGRPPQEAKVILAEGGGLALKIQTILSLPDQYQKTIPKSLPAKLFVKRPFSQTATMR
jgi:hypothetical protein